MKVINHNITIHLTGSLKFTVAIFVNPLGKIQRRVSLNLEKENDFETHAKHATFSKCL